VKVSTQLLAGLVAALLLVPGMAAERIVDAQGRTLDADALVTAIAASDIALLGERHDNVRHHERRGELLQALKRRIGQTTVVIEHLDRERGFDFNAVCISSEHGLERVLTSIGFDAKGWRWPLHRPMFSALAATGANVLGGNIPRAAARQIATDGEAALPASTAAQLAAAPLLDNARQRLDADLVRGHCGTLDSIRLPGLRLAQRARDAAMADTLLAAATPGKPVILLAGNGHVRRDYGVPTLLGNGPRIVSVGFVEDAAELEAARHDGLYDYLWLTDPAVRSDPCAELRKAR
jgi:uncharacterized iron-regulated protein